MTGSGDHLLPPGIVWHLLFEEQTHFQDLGADFYDKRRGTEAIKRNHVRQLEALGFSVTLHPTAA